MSSLTTTWSPNSFQLRPAFNGRKTATVVFLRTRIHKLDRRFRLLSVAKNSAVNGNGMERRRSGDSWAVNSISSVDGFAGWTGDEQSDDSRPKQSLKGLVGAGVAGVVLVAGVTFAALSIGKRSPSGVKQQMEPLTSSQEMSMSSDDLNSGIKEDKNDSKNDTRDVGTEQRMASIVKDPSSSTESNEATESKHSDDTGMNDAPSDGNGTNFAPIKQDLQNESAIDDMSVDPEDLPKPPDTQIASSSFAAKRSETLDAYVPSLKRATLSESEGENLVANSSPFTDSMSNLNNDHKEDLSVMRETKIPNFSLELPANEPSTINTSLRSQCAVLEPKIMHDMDLDDSSSSSKKEFDLNKTQEVSAEGDEASLGLHNVTKTESTGMTLLPDVAYTSANEELVNIYGNSNESGPLFDSSSGNIFSSAGIPAPSVVSAAMQAVPGKVLVPATVDQVQGQALAALQALKVIEADVQPGDLCTRREYARWLVSASSALSRCTVSKVYPAMYIENVTELAFDDITAEDPDFPSIQGLAEAGLISSKLSRQDMQSSLDGDSGPFCFSPESPLSRQDLVSWKMAFEKKLLPVVDRKNLQQLTGFIDVDKINPDAWPALVADLEAGEQGIMALALGYTRLFQPDKPVTKAQAAIALSTGEASDIVSEELARIEAESMAENVVAAQNALVAQVEKDVNATFEKELQLERKKVDAVENLAEAARQELEMLRVEWEGENLKLMKERAAVNSEMEVLSRLRREVEEQLQTLMSNKVEVSYEKERLSKLRKAAEFENQEIAQLQYELKVERKALSMVRSWAEEEAKRAREQAKALEDAREHWARQGIKVVVDDDLREEENAGVTWLCAGKEVSVEGTVGRAETLVDTLKSMADDVSGKSRDTINKTIQKILHIIDNLKEWIMKAGRQAGELKDTAISKMGTSLQEVQHTSSEFSSAVKGGIKRVAEDCREGVEKITQKFKT